MLSTHNPLKSTRTVDLLTIVESAWGKTGAHKLTLILLLALVIALVVPTALPSHTCAGTADSQGRGPLCAANGELFDTSGQQVHLSGINWFGFETGSFAPEGLDVRNYQDMLNQISRLGFNTVRLPYSNQLFEPGSTPTNINYRLNPDLRGLSGLALMDKIVAGARRAGLWVLLDQHRPNAYAQSDLWYTREVSEARWIGDWAMLARHYKGDSTVLGADLHNEPKGAATWGDGNRATDWRLAAERGGNAILAVNPNWLIVVEGIENYHGDYYWWGSNLEGAKPFPVRLSHPDKLVYSAHDYGPEVYPQAWLQRRGFARQLPTVWEHHWAYLQINGVAPILVGEFGGHSVGNDPGGQWQRTLAQYLQRHGLSYTYWSWTPNSWDTGGLLTNNWKTVDPSKLSILPYIQPHSPTR